MDSFDIFCQLARGAVFRGKKKAKVRTPVIKQEPQMPIKEEPPMSIEEELAIEDPVIHSPSVVKTETLEILSGTSIGDTTLPGDSKPVKGKSVVSDAERINLLRKSNKITVIGKNVPAPITAFEELKTNYKFSSKLLSNITTRHASPTPIQMQAIPVMQMGRALMACAPTGSGKTIAYLAPIINDLKAPKKDGIRAIILAPTRELAQQIYRECVRLSEKTALKIRIISKVAQTGVKDGQKKEKSYDILISTPNRVRFLLQQDPPGLDLTNVDWFVIDEADKMLEDSNNSFKDQFVDILNACTKPSKKMALFSATYTVPVSKWALRHLKGLVRVTIGQQNSAVDSIKQELLFVGSESGKLIAVRDLIRTGLKPPVLIFVQSKDRAKQLFDELLYDGINVDVIHSDRLQQQRDNVVKAFREGQIWVLICTELLARGIDFKGVNLVINYDFPPSTISYIHRIGRTGRAGREGHAITFFTQNDTPNLRDVAQVITNSGGQVPEYMLKLKKTKKSIKKQLLNNAPKRDVISTDPKFEERRKRKLSKVGQFVRRLPVANEGSERSPRDGKLRKKVKIVKDHLKHDASSRPKPNNKKKTKK